MTNLERLKTIGSNDLAKSLAEVIYTNATYMFKNMPEEDVYERYVAVIECWLLDEYVPSVRFPVFNITSVAT